jgi:hypothetical protein
MARPKKVETGEATTPSSGVKRGRKPSLSIEEKLQNKIAAIRSEIEGKQNELNVAEQALAKYNENKDILDYINNL